MNIFLYIDLFVMQICVILVTQWLIYISQHVCDKLKEQIILADVSFWH